MFTIVKSTIAKKQLKSGGSLFNTKEMIFWHKNFPPRHKTLYDTIFCHFLKNIFTSMRISYITFERRMLLEKWTYHWKGNKMFYKNIVLCKIDVLLKYVRNSHRCKDIFLKISVEEVSFSYVLKSDDWVLKMSTKKPWTRL